MLFLESIQIEYYTKGNETIANKIKILVKMNYILYGKMSVSHNIIFSVMLFGSNYIEIEKAWHSRER